MLFTWPRRRWYSFAFRAENQPRGKIPGLIINTINYQPPLRRALASSRGKIPHDPEPKS